MLGAGMAAVPGAMTRLRRAMALLNNEWPKEWSPEELVLAVQTGNRIALAPSTAVTEVGRMVERAESALKTLGTMHVSESTRCKAEAQIRAAIEMLR